MSDRKWKTHLLSSGVPLEYSVLRVFETLGIPQPREFQYERPNEVGRPTVFSVDVHASHADFQRNLWLEILVECKYRHDGTCWVFAPLAYQSVSEGFSELLVVLDQFDVDRRIDTSLFRDPDNRYPLCERGVEILPKDVNPKSIDQAIHQLRYAVVAKALDAVRHQVNRMLGSPTPLFTILPIVVTTAEIWRLKQDTTIEAVRRAAELTDVATQHDIVVVRRSPDNFDERHTRHLFESELTKDEKNELETALRVGSQSSFEFFVNRFSSHAPSLFLVVHYSRFEKAMRNFLGFFAQPQIIQARSPR